VKIDRFSSASTRGAAVLLAGLLAAGQPAAGQTYTYKLGKTKPPEDSSKALAEELTVQMQLARKTFEKNRKTLRIVQLPGGKPAYLRENVDALISHTREDLKRAIENIRLADTKSLSNWTTEEIQGIQAKLAATPVATAASLPGFSTPRAVAVVASLGGLPLGLASVGVAPQPETVSTETSNGLLDEVGNVISRILFLSSRNDLYVKLWVGSTPKTGAKFSFSAQGQIKGSTPAPVIIKTDGKKDLVLRGLYVYRATHAEGPVTELIQYPSPAGVPAAQTASERLDLVNGSRFFCCRFDEHYCQHVADEKECHP
jgi:hypothetical protein